MKLNRYVRTDDFFFSFFPPYNGKQRTAFMNFLHEKDKAQNFGQRKLSVSLWCSMEDIRNEGKTHLLCDVLAAFQVMISIRQDLRLYDGNNAMLGQGKQTWSGQR